MTPGFEPEAFALTDVVISAFASNQLEQVVGFEPTINGFAGRRLWPLGYTCEGRVIFDFGSSIFGFESKIKVQMWKGRRDSNPLWAVRKTACSTALHSSPF
jgi:hypothetical protein